MNSSTHMERRQLLNTAILMMFCLVGAGLAFVIFGMSLASLLICGVVIIACGLAGNYLNDRLERQRLALLRTLPGVVDVRIVTFAGNDHIHIDFANGNIGIMSIDDDIQNLSITEC